MSRVRHIKRKLHAEDEIAWEQFDLDTIDFAAAMVKREAPGPFEAAPIIQGKFDGSGVSDVVSLPRGNLIGNQTQFEYANFDPYQGAVSFWITPEWDGDDGLTHYVGPHNANWISIFKHSTDVLILGVPSIASMVSVDVSAWTAGTTYYVIARWNSRNTLDGTHYCCLSINDIHTFDRTTTIAIGAPLTPAYIGSTGMTSPANALIEGLTVYRRPLTDGTYGVRPMNGNQYAGDEINAIWNAGAGRDPTLVTGSEDVVLCVPTDSDDGGELTTGAGEAWSWPVGDNLLDVHGAWDGGFPGTDRAVEFNGVDTSINCGSDVDIDDIMDAEATVEIWFRADSYGDDGRGRIFSKAASGTAGGWVWLLDDEDGIIAYVWCATDFAYSRLTLAQMPVDGKLHHMVMYFNDAGDRKIYFAIDGKWATSYATQQAGTGAIKTDVANDLYIGSQSNGGAAFDGGFAWAAISNNARYTPGTDFIPPRALPADDANYLAIWGMEEGTGTDIDNTGDQGGGGSGAANRDGTLANGTWSSIWEQDGTPVIPQSLEFDGAATFVDCGSAADIDDLCAGGAIMQVEGWFRFDRVAAGNKMLVSKGNLTALDAGWMIYQDSTSIRMAVVLADAFLIKAIPFVGNSTWCHVLATYNDTTKIIRLAIDGIWGTASAPGSGAYVSDAALDLRLGRASAGTDYYYSGAMGFVKIHDDAHYTPGTTFVPHGRTNPPAADELRQFNFTDGAGTTLTDATATANGTITMGAGQWNNTPDMAIDEPGAAIYGPKGYNIGSDGVNDGLYIEQVVVAETDYVVFPVISFGVSGRARAQIRVRDVSNAADVVTFPGPLLYGQHGGGNNEAALAHPTGKWPHDQLVGWPLYNITDGSKATVTGCDDTEVAGTLSGGTDNDWDTGDTFLLRAPNGYDNWPWQESFCFQTPAGCTLLRVYIENPNGEGVLQVHQMQVLPNLLVNGDHESLTGGNPDLITGWTNSNLDAGDTEASSTGDGVIHTGDEALQWNVGAVNENIYYQFVTVVGEFYAFGGWYHPDGTAGFRHGTAGVGYAVTQYDDAVYRLDTPVTARWHSMTMLLRARSTDLRVALYGRTGAAGSRFTDDIYIIQMDDVSLTVTPANEANSLEDTGIRIDGLDTVTDTPTLLRAHQGNLEFGATPRHPPAEAQGFGQIREYLVTLYEDANNWLEFYRHNNALTLRCVAQGAVEINDTDNIAGDWDAGVLSVFRIAYGPGGVRVWRDGVHIMTALGSAVFATAFTSIEWGTDENQIRQFDGVISPA